MLENGAISIERWVELQQAKGRNGFALTELRKECPQQTDTALKYALIRLSDKGKILSIHKGYYLIITPQYTLKGMLPPVLFIDGLMKYLNRPYYVGLLNAAVFHGSSHQAPQEFFVVTTFPVLRPTTKKGIKINYLSRKEINKTLLESRKTDWGYIQVSQPILTAADLVQYEKRIGGLTRAANIILDLKEEIKEESITKTFLTSTHVSTLQRLGYILEEVINAKSLANTLFKLLSQLHKRLRPVLLKTSKDKYEYTDANRWKVIVNTEIILES